MTPEVHEDGTVLFRCGERHDRLYYVTDGVVLLTQPAAADPKKHHSPTNAQLSSGARTPHADSPMNATPHRATTIGRQHLDSTTVSPSVTLHVPPNADSFGSASGSPAAACRPTERLLTEFREVNATLRQPGEATNGGR